MRKFILYSLLLCTSCIPLVKGLYGINKTIRFKSKVDYTQYLITKNKLNISDLYYIDSKNYEKFLRLFENDNFDYFYGIFLNDSLKYNKSDFLKENGSCLGRIEQEIKLISKNTDNISLANDTIFKNFTFKHIINEKKLEIPNNKRTIVLLFSYQYGTLRSKDFNEIKKLVEENKEYELIIITVDAVDGLKNK